MHELSIAAAVIDEVSKHVSRAGGARVRSIRLRIGRLSCVREASLRFCFDLASADTELSGARLEIVEVPVRIWCPGCATERELPGVQSLACPACGRSCGDIRAGRELDLDSIELEPCSPSVTGQPGSDPTMPPPIPIEPEATEPPPLPRRDEP